MIYLYNLEKTDEENIFIPKACHYMPFDKQHGMKDEEGNLKTKEELEKEGFLLDKEIKLSYEEDGDVFELFVNMETREHFYKCTGKVEEQPKSKEETLASVISQLTVEDKKKDAMINQLAQQVNSLNIELNKLKGDAK